MNLHLAERMITIGSRRRKKGRRKKRWWWMLHVSHCTAGRLQIINRISDPVMVSEIHTQTQTHSEQQKQFTPMTGANTHTLHLHPPNTHTHTHQLISATIQHQRSQIKTR